MSSTLEVSPNRPLLTVPETARYLGIGKTLAWQLIEQGIIPSVRLGRLVRVPRARLDAWLGGAADELLSQHHAFRRVRGRMDTA